MLKANRTQFPSSGWEGWGGCTGPWLGSALVLVPDGARRETDASRTLAGSTATRKHSKRGTRREVLSGVCRIANTAKRQDEAIQRTGLPWSPSLRALVVSVVVIVGLLRQAGADQVRCRSGTDSTLEDSQ